MASTAESMLPCAVISTTQLAGCSRRICSSRAMPERSGILRSVSTTSKAWRRRAASALRPLARRLDLVALRAQDQPQDLELRRLVVDDEDARLHARSAPCRGRRGQRRRTHRQQQAHARPLAGHRVERDRAAVALDDPTDERQAEPDARLLRRDVGLEGARRGVLRHPDPGVGDEHGNRRRVVRPLEPRRERQPAAAGHRLEGVQHQVQEAGLEQLGVGDGRRQRGSHVQLDLGSPARGPCAPRGRPSRARRRPRRTGAGRAARAARWRESPRPCD